MKYVREGEQLSIYFGFDHDSDPFSLFVIDEEVLRSLPNDAGHEFDDKVCLSIGFQATIDLQRAQGTREEIHLAIAQAFEEEWIKEYSDEQMRKDTVSDYLEDTEGKKPTSDEEIAAFRQRVDREYNVLYDTAFKHQMGSTPREHKERTKLEVADSAREQLAPSEVSYSKPGDCVFIFGEVT